MAGKLNDIGTGLAEAENEDFDNYYVDNEYYEKASSFSKKHRELFFIGRTGSGKSAILEMIRIKKGDASRVINITEEDFAVEILLSRPEVTDIPMQHRTLAFKTLWKYVIIVNILKTLHGNSDNSWDRLLYGNSNDKKVLKILDRFGELSIEQKNLTEQIISFIQLIQTICIIEDKYQDLYNLFRLLNNFEKYDLQSHVAKKYLYILIDDLDKNWTGSQDNVDLIRCLFECIVEMGRNFNGNIKFVVALRTDIFKQIKFHQTEKIRPYVIELRWYNWQLEEIVKSRLRHCWKISLEDVVSRFPDRVQNQSLKERNEDGKIDLDLRYFIHRSMRRPRDIISFINLCIHEANLRGVKYISERDIISAEKVYSKQRMEALIDEWQYIYPDLNKWFDLFAGKKNTMNYIEFKNIFSKEEEEDTKKIIDILYEVGFLGYWSEEYEEYKFSFISRSSPGFNCTYRVHEEFYSYLNERAEDLGLRRFREE